MQKNDKFEMIQSSRDTKSNVISIEHNRMCRTRDRTVRRNKEVETVRLVVIDRVGDVKDALGFH